ncbi:MAG: hypothetical protein NZ572_06570 [Thermoflexus sp.]|nr:hypothetical protein [Thermoflexus sp.]
MRFRYAFTVKAPIERISALHQDPLTLEHLMPPFLRLEWEHREPIAEGSLARFVIRLGPFRIRWTALHRAVSALGFTDEQVEGPFQRWVHRHSFQACGPRCTRIVEEIEARWPRHPIRWILATGMWLGLPFLFAYRARRIREMAERRS